MPLKAILFLILVVTRRLFSISCLCCFLVSCLCRFSCWFSFLSGSLLEKPHLHWFNHLVLNSMGVGVTLRMIFTEASRYTRLTLTGYDIESVSFLHFLVVQQRRSSPSCLCRFLVVFLSLNKDSELTNDLLARPH